MSNQLPTSSIGLLSLSFNSYLLTRIKCVTLEWCAVAAFSYVVAPVSLKVINGGTFCGSKIKQNQTFKPTLKLFAYLFSSVAEVPCACIKCLFLLAAFLGANILVNVYKQVWVSCPFLKGTFQVLFSEMQPTSSIHLENYLLSWS